MNIFNGIVYICLFSQSNLQSIDWTLRNNYRNIFYFEFMWNAASSTIVVKSMEPQTNISHCTNRENEKWFYFCSVSHLHILLSKWNTIVIKCDKHTCSCKIHNKFVETLTLSASICHALKIASNTCACTFKAKTHILTDKQISWSIFKNWQRIKIHNFNIHCICWWMHPQLHDILWYWKYMA